MKVSMIKEYRGEMGYYPGGHIVEVNRDAGKWLIRNGYAVENTAGTTNQDWFVTEHRPPEQPQVIIMPYPVQAEEEE